MKCAECSKVISVGFVVEDKTYCIKHCPVEIELHGEYKPNKRMTMQPKGEFNIEVIE